MAKSTKIVFCSCGCSVKLMGVKTSYPTDLGVERRGLIALLLVFGTGFLVRGALGVL